MKTIKNTLRTLTFVAVLAAFSSCTKNSDECKDVPPEQEESVMRSFMAANGMTGVKSPEGMFYQILDEGGLAKPNTNSTIYVIYKGTHMDGSVFDEQTNPGATGFRLLEMIQGWQKAMPMIGKGGRMRLIVPSSLAYGCEGRGEIDPNTPLYFEFTLVDFL